MIRDPILSFNAGELSPMIDARSDVDKYRAGCRRLENMIPRIYGAGERRPGTKYIDTCDGVARVISFIYSDTIAYILLLEDQRMYFYHDGAQVLDALGRRLRIDTPYTAAELFDIQYKQNNDVMWLTHPNHPPYKLQRTSANSFTLTEIVFDKGPFLVRHDQVSDDGMTMSPSVTAKGATGTLTSSTAYFDAGHVGTVFSVTQPRYITGMAGSCTFPLTGPTAWIPVEGSFTFTTHGTWTGTVALERTIDDGVTVETYRKWTSAADRNVQLTESEWEEGVKYRFNVLSMGANVAYPKIDSKVFMDFTVNSATETGICRVTGYASPTQMTMEVLKAFATAGAADKRWAEGAWSAYRGYPRCVTFFEDRAVYAGTAHEPQTVWFSRTDDYQYMTASFVNVNRNDDPFGLTIGAETRDAITWITAIDGLLVGTTGGEWRIRSSKYDETVTPTNYSFKQQTSYGSSSVQALPVNDCVLFVDYVRRRVRELRFDYSVDKYVAPDLTALAEHITACPSSLALSGITCMAFQKSPDPILWAIRRDGVLLSMTYEREQNVIAWARHPFSLGAAGDANPDDWEGPEYTASQYRYYYSFDFGGVRFRALDTENDYAQAAGYSQGGIVAGMDVAPDGRLVFTTTYTGWPPGSATYYLGLFNPEDHTFTYDFFEPTGGNWYTGTYTTGLSRISVRMDPWGTACYFLYRATDPAVATLFNTKNRAFIIKLSMTDGTELARWSVGDTTGGVMGMEVDRNGYIYVYDNGTDLSPYQDTVCRWYVFDANGNKLAEYELPPNPLNVAGDRIPVFASGLYINDFWVDPDLANNSTGFVFMAGKQPVHSVTLPVTSATYAAIYWRSFDGSDTVTFMPGTQTVENAGTEFTSICVHDGYIYATSDRVNTGAYYASVWKIDIAGNVVAHYDTGGRVAYGTFDWQGNYVVKDVQNDLIRVLSPADCASFDTYYYTTHLPLRTGSEECVAVPRLYWSMTAHPATAPDYSNSGLGPNSVAVIPSTNEDEVWLVVGRVINGQIVRYLEQMQPRRVVEPEDEWFVDAGLDYRGTPTTTFSGLDHLEGEEVAILADGWIMPRQTVTGGTIILPAPFGRVIAGLPFRYLLKSMRFDLNVQGTTKGTIKRFAEVVVSFYKALNAQYGVDEDHLFEWKDWRTTEDLTEPTRFCTGDKIAVHDGGFGVEDEFVVTGDDPVPCTVRAIVPRIDISGR